jgi:hypothetical protein
MENTTRLKQKSYAWFINSCPLGRTVNMSHVDGINDGIGYGVSGRNNINYGVGVLGESTSEYGGVGILGRGNRSGVYGSATSFGPSGVLGCRDYRGEYGVYGSANGYYNSYGVFGVSSYGPGVRGESYYGKVSVLGESVYGVGVHGNGILGPGMWGLSNSGYGIIGYSHQSIGIYGWGHPGVYGESDFGPGLSGRSSSSYGIHGYSNSGDGIYGGSTSGLAARFDGNVRVNGRLRVTGTLQKGGGSFTIDHPLDPANKYLSHSFVESPEMKNVYDGIVALDDKGEAEIGLPDWFGALNDHFRYQLTAIGAPGPNLHIAEEITNTDDYNSGSGDKNKKGSSNRFKVAGGTSEMKVSWQVTGIRKDPWANANRIQVEEDKPSMEQGCYMYPYLYDQPEEKGICRLFNPEEKWQGQLVHGNKQRRRF